MAKYDCSQLESRHLTMIQTSNSFSNSDDYSKVKF